MATAYFPNESGSSNVRGILTYTSSQTDTQVTVNLSAVLQVNGRYGSGYQCLIKVNNETVKDVTGHKDPPAVAGWTQFLSTGNWSKTYNRGSTDQTLTVVASFAGKSSGGYYPGTGSGSVTVTISIPKLAQPTVTQTNYAKTGATISMNWSSNMTIDYVWCSTDGGSTWKAIGTANSKTGSYTVAGLSPNTTYSVKTRLRAKDSQLTGDSSATSVKTYAKATCTQSLNSKTDTTIKMNWSSDSTCDALWYSTNGGTSWTLVGQINASSGTYTISGLSADTAYSIKTRVRGLNAGLTTDSSALSVTTYGYPTVSISLNSKTDTQIKINWSSGSTCDYAWYSINNGTSWTGVDVTDGTSGVITISGLTADTTYTIKVRLRRKDSQYTRDSSALSVTTYGYPTVTQSLSSKTETTITMAWSSGSVCDYLWYSTNNGSSWTGVDVTDGTSGTYTISGLSANTAYNIKTRLRRKDSQYTRDSSALAVTTYDYPHATGMPNFTIGNELTITVYNPLGRSFTLTFIGADGSTKTTGSYTGTAVKGFNNSSWTTFLYASIPSAKSGTYQAKITYGSVNRTNNGGTYSINTSACTPSIGSLSYIDTNSTTTTVTTDNTKIVQNLSVVRYTASSLSVKNSATISSVKIAVNGQTYNLTVSGSSATGGNASIDSASNVTATATITDSRGLTATKTVTVQMLAWSLPSALISLRRQSNYYTESYLKVDAIYSSVNGKNTITITYTGSAVPQTGKTTPASVSGSLSDNVQITLQLDNEFDWQFTIVLTDAFGTKTFYVQLSRGTPIMFWDDRLNSVGVGKFPSHQNSFEVAGDAYFGGEVFDKNNYNIDIRTHVKGQASVTGSGWKRIAHVTGASNGTVIGTYAFGIDISVSSSFYHNNNAFKKISLIATYNNVKFVDETSVSNYNQFTNIRYMTTSGADGYIDVYYNSSSENTCMADFVLRSAYLAGDNSVKVTPVAFESVASAPSGEAVRAEYTFNSNVASVNQNGTATPASGVTLSETRVVRRGNTVEVKFYATCATAPAIGAETLLATISGVTLPLSSVRWLAGQGVHWYDAYSSAYAILQSSDGKIYVRGSQGSRPVFTIDVTYTVDS